jgi:hypothetical protein
MSSEIPHPEEVSELRRATDRVKKAHAKYSRFLATAPLTSADVPLHDTKEMRAAQEEVRSAEAEMKRVYAEHLRRDPEFLSRSREAEAQLKKGPPWEDEFSSIDSLMDSEQSGE